MILTALDIRSSDDWTGTGSACGHPKTPVDEPMEIPMTLFVSPTRTAPIAPLARARAMVRGIVEAVTQAFVRYQNRRSVNELMGWSDGMLKDIGLTRGDVYRALACPMSQDPSARLIILGVERRALAKMQAQERHRMVTKCMHPVNAALDSRADAERSPCTPS
jgi:uncharacterized protein YjiS (DUF1127 family)